MDEDVKSALHAHRLVYSPIQKQSLVFFEFYFVIDKAQRRKSLGQSELEKMVEKKVKRKTKQKFSELKLATLPTSTAAVQKTRYKFCLTSDGSSKSDKKLLRGNHFILKKI